MDRKTSTVKEQTECKEQLHKALHNNLHLLSLHRPMSEEFLACFGEGMLKKPNSNAFNHCSLYLMRCIAPDKYDTPDMDYLIGQPKTINQFRQTLVSFIDDVAKRHRGYVSPVVPSWLVTAGGYKVVRLLFELTQVAMKVFILKKQKTLDKSLDFSSGIPETITEEAMETAEKSLALKRSRLNRLREENDKNKKSYEEQLKTTADATSTSRENLNKFIDSLRRANIKNYRDIADITTKSHVLETCKEAIDLRITALEDAWDSLNPLLDTFKRCKSICEGVVAVYTNRSSNVLAYDPDVDRFNFDVESVDFMKKDFVELQRNLVRDDGVLHFPTLLRLFNVVLYQNVAALSVFKIGPEYAALVDEKLRRLNDKEREAKRIRDEMQVLYKNLEKDADYKLLDRPTDGNKWILDALNV